MDFCFGIQSQVLEVFKHFCASVEIKTYKEFVRVNNGGEYMGHLSIIVGNMESGLIRQFQGFYNLMKLLRE